MKKDSDRQTKKKKKQSGTFYVNRARNLIHEKSQNPNQMTVQDEIMMLKSFHADIVTKFCANGLLRRSVDQDEFVFRQSHVNLRYYVDLPTIAI